MIEPFFSTRFWIASLTELGVIVTLRAFPVVVAALSAPNMRLPIKMLAALSFAVLAWLSSNPRELPAHWLCIAYAYFGIAGALVHRIPQLLRRGKIGRLSTFAAGAITFLLIPAIAVPGGFRVAALVIGWDLMLKSYSYCVDVATGRSEPTLKDCLFFLLVNPVIVYAERGRRLEGHAAAVGLWRSLWGIAVLLASITVVGQLVNFTRHGLRGAFGLEQPLAALMLLGVLQFVLIYSQHAGLASLQIGFMRQLGYVVPERYNFPILAANPLDFWRRWNTYVGHWLSRYVFWPLVLRLSRKRSRAHVRVAQAFGLIVTFTITGVLHDAYTLASTFSVPLRGVMAFSQMGGLVLLWAICVELSHRNLKPASWAPQQKALLTMGTITLSWLAMFIWFGTWASMRT